jgi:hypothetical protein
VAEIEHLHTIVAGGTSADRQVDIFTKATAAGRRRLTALKEVVDWAAAETQALGGRQNLDPCALRASPYRRGHL